MSEQTDKASQKPRKAPAGKRAPRKARPSAASKSGSGRKSGKDTAREESPQAKSAPAKAVQAKAASTDKAGANKNRAANKAAKSAAPDPATIVFGSNRPIVAPPPPKPLSSGLRFSGPSDGVLKSSGAQATSPKAEGLTFAEANNEEASTGSAAAKPKRASAPESKQNKQKNQSKQSKLPESGKTGGTKPAAKSDGNKSKAPGKANAVTKPAIAPQNHGPLIEKEPSRGPLGLIALGIAAAALVWWLANQPSTQIAGGEHATSGEQEPDAGAPAGGGSEMAAAPAEQVTAVPQGESPIPAPAPAAATLTVAELREVRDLLGKIGLDSGVDSAAMTEATRAAIRDYQTMAGLPVDGEATPALLEELRTVAALYGN